MLITMEEPRGALGTDPCKGRDRGLVVALWALTYEAIGVMGEDGCANSDGLDELGEGYRKEDDLETPNYWCQSSSLQVLIGVKELRWSFGHRSLGGHRKSHGH